MEKSYKNKKLEKKDSFGKGSEIKKNTNKKKSKRMIEPLKNKRKELEQKEVLLSGIIFFFLFSAFEQHQVPSLPTFSQIKEKHNKEKRQKWECARFCAFLRNYEK